MFNELKEKLKNEIKVIRDVNPMSVSWTYRKNITSKADNKSFIHVPVDTPFIRNIKSILLIIFATFLAILTRGMFVRLLGIYSTGLRSITQTIFYLIQNYYPDVPQYYSHLLFITINIPLAILGYLVISKGFTFFYNIFFNNSVFFSMVVFNFTSLDNLIKPFGKTNIKKLNMYMFC